MAKKPWYECIEREKSRQHCPFCGFDLGKELHPFPTASRIDCPSCKSEVIVDLDDNVWPPLGTWTKFCSKCGHELKTIRSSNPDYSGMRACPVCNSEEFQQYEPRTLGFHMLDSDSN